MKKRVICILLTIGYLGLIGCNSNKTIEKTKNTEKNDSMIITDDNINNSYNSKQKETESIDTITDEEREVTNIDNDEPQEEEVLDTSNEAENNEKTENIDEDIYGYDLEKASQFSKEIQQLNKKVAYYLEQFENGVIVDKEFVENIKDLPAKYEQLDIEFLQGTKYYDNMYEGIHETIRGINGIVQAVENEDGKTLNQGMRLIKREQILINDTLNQMAEDLEYN